MKASRFSQAVPGTPATTSIRGLPSITAMPTRNARPGMVRSARLERKLADQRRADTLSTGAGYGRIRSVRFRVQARNGRIAQDAGVLCRLFPARFGEASRLLHNLERSRHRARWNQSAAEAGSLQLVGGHGIQSRRSGADCPGRKGGETRRRTLRDGRRLVRQAEQRSRRAGRLGREPGEIPEWPEWADLRRQWTRHGFRVMGRAGDGESG